MQLWHIINLINQNHSRDYLHFFHFHLNLALIQITYFRRRLPLSLPHYLIVSLAIIAILQLKQVLILHWVALVLVQPAKFTNGGCRGDHRLQAVGSK